MLSQEPVPIEEPMGGFGERLLAVMAAITLHPFGVRCSKIAAMVNDFRTLDLAHLTFNAFWSHRLQDKRKDQAAFCLVAPLLSNN